MYEAFFNDEVVHNTMNLDKLILSIKNGSSIIEDKIFDEKLRMNQHGDIVAVDKLFHKAYVDKEDTDNFILVFRKRDVYDEIKDDIGMSYARFSIFVDTLKNAILIDNAMRNYRVGHDKNKTIYNWYVELFGKNKDEFASIKISKKKLYGL
jgi:ASC-1-like (ASCH) protein